VISVSRLDRYEGLKDNRRTVKHARVGRPQWREDPLREEGTGGGIEQLACPALEGIEEGGSSEGLFYRI